MPKPLRLFGRGDEIVAAGVDAAVRSRRGGLDLERRDQAVERAQGSSQQGIDEHGIDGRMLVEEIGHVTQAPRVAMAGERHADQSLFMLPSVARRFVSLFALPLVVASGSCSGEDSAEPALTLRTRVEGEPRSGAVPAVAWASVNVGLSSYVGARMANAPPGELSLRGLPAATLEVGDVRDEAERVALSIGHMVLVVAAQQDIPRLDRFPGVRFGDGPGQRALWCPPQETDVWNEASCYSETYACVDEDCICPSAECSVTSTAGEPRFRHPWGLADGIASEWLVFYAHKDIPSAQMATIGYEGALEVGYQLIRVRRLEGRALDASRACWQGAINDSIAARQCRPRHTVREPHGHPQPRCPSQPQRRVSEYGQ